MRSPTCRANVASASGSSTPNSSPRSRATRSPSPSASPRRTASSRTMRSPLWWPSVFVTSRKRSRARISSASGRSGPRGLGEGAAEPVLEQDAVRQPGQLVEEPHLAQRLLGQPLLRDVQDETPHEARLAVGPRQRPPFVAPPQHPPLAVEDAVLRGEASSRRAGVAELAQHPLPVLRVKPSHPHVRLGEPLPRREARHREQLRAHVGAAAGVVRPGHVGERRDLLDQGAVAVRRRPRRRGRRPGATPPDPARARRRPRAARRPPGARSRARRRARSRRSRPR